MRTEISKLVEPFNILINSAKRRLNMLITKELGTVIVRDVSTKQEVLLELSNIEDIKGTINVLTHLYKEKYEIYRQVF